jgi:hypothetical protein
VPLDLHRLDGVFGPPAGVGFTLLVSPDLAGLIEVVDRDRYSNTCVEIMSPNDLPEIIESLSGPSHVLCVTSDERFVSPRYGRRNVKLGVVPLYSTQPSFGKLKGMLELLQSLDYTTQDAASDQLVRALDGTNRLELRDERFAAKAWLDVWSGPNQLHFFKQAGPLPWGGQCVLPSGEVSLLTDPHGAFSTERTFALSGTLVLDGTPIVHRGMCPCQISRARQCPAAGGERSGVQTCPAEHSELFARLATLRHSPVEVSLTGGEIDGLRCLGPDTTASHCLTELFERDASYRKVHEIGFGLNSPKTGAAGENYLPNEMVKGMHFGLGLTPFTAFHLDFTVQHTRARHAS